MISEAELKEIEDRCNKSQPGIWKSYIEGRDHESGDYFIMTGVRSVRGMIFIFEGASKADIDFIASSKQDIPRLIEEVRL